MKSTPSESLTAPISLSSSEDGDDDFASDAQCASFRDAEALPTRRRKQTMRKKLQPNTSRGDDSSTLDVASTPRSESDAEGRLENRAPRRLRALRRRTSLTQAVAAAFADETSEGEEWIDVGGDADDPVLCCEEDGDEFAITEKLAGSPAFTSPAGKAASRKTRLQLDESRSDAGNARSTDDVVLMTPQRSLGILAEQASAICIDSHSKRVREQRRDGRIEAAEVDPVSSQSLKSGSPKGSASIMQRRLAPCDALQIQFDDGDAFAQQEPCGPIFDLLEEFGRPGETLAEVSKRIGVSVLAHAAVEARKRGCTVVNDDCLRGTQDWRGRESVAFDFRFAQHNAVRSAPKASAAKLLGAPERKKYKAGPQRTRPKFKRKFARTRK